MAEVRFTNAAEADLIDIDEFSIAHFGQATGEAYMHGFNEAFARLSHFPMVGSATPEDGPGIHRLTYRSHQIFYRMNGDAVLILRVLHHARDARRHLPK